MNHLKLLYLGLILTLILPQSLFSQAPDGVNYQAVVRNALGLPLNMQAVSVRFSIHQGSPTGTVVFTETQPTTTNQFGLINLELGSVNNLAFSTINWGTGGAYYLQIEVDAGSGFDNLGASQLLSVPYALFARAAATGAQGFNSLIDTIGAPVAACPNGGYIVRTGLDANANTVLDAGEISSSFVVCNGLDGAANVNDTSATNELQTLNLSNDTIFLSSGGFVVLPPATPDNDWIIAGPNMSSGILGNVGIGTLTPSKKLSIQSAAAVGDGIQINNAGLGNPGIEYQTQGTTRYVMGIDQSDNNKFKLGTSGVNVNTRMTIDGSGKVGIGTTIPPYQFSVQSTDSVVASFVGTNPNVAAIIIANPNPTAVTGIVMLSGVDSGMIGVDPANKTLWLSHSTPGGHAGIYADSAVALYGDVIGNVSRSKIINIADTIYNLPLTSNLINVNIGTFFTDSLYVLGNNFNNANWVLANDGLGQAVWTDPSTLGLGGGAWSSNGTETTLNSPTDFVGVGTTSPLAKLHVADNAQTILGVESSNANPTDGSHISLLRSRGVTTAPTNVVSGDRIGTVEFLGYDAISSNYEEVISIRGFADETYNGGSTASHLEFHVNPLGQSTMIEAMRIQGNGFIGLGTTTPISKFHIFNGTMTIDNGVNPFTFPLADGVANQVLATDGLGNVTWQTPPGGASPWTILGSNIFQLNLGDFVGIGTNAPGGPLHITDANNNINASQFIIEANSSGGPQTFAALEFRANANAAGVGPVGRIKTYYVNPLFTSATMTFQTVTGGPSFVDVMSLTDGKVGIGTTTPVSSFNIIYSGADAEASLINYTNNSASAAGTGFYVNANNTGSGIITAGGFQVNSSTNAIETIVLDANNIAIGTTNYGLRTAVAGAGTTNFGIYAEVSGATTNWAAYFANGGVFIGSNLVIPTLAGVGRVLTSDASGNATWKDNQIGFEARSSTNQGVNNIPSLLAFDAISFDDGGNFDPSAGNYSFTAPVGGVYSFHVNVLFDYSGGGPNEMTVVEVLLNGSPIYTTDKPLNPGERNSNNNSSTVRLNVGDVLQVQVYNLSGGAIMTGAADEVWFSGHLIYAY